MALGIRNGERSSREFPGKGSFSVAENTIAEIFAPGFMARRIPASALGGLENSMRAVRQMTASNESGSTSMFSASITRVSTLVSPAFRAVWLPSSASLKKGQWLRRSRSDLPVEPLTKSVLQCRRYIKHTVTALQAGKVKHHFCCWPDMFVASRLIAAPMLGDLVGCRVYSRIAKIR